MSMPKRQVASLPYRVADERMEILLVTSRDTRRWVLPKGNLIAGMAPHRVAEREAFEEAGVSGIVCPAPVGHYTYDKRTQFGRRRETLVTVYPLAALQLESEWPERWERERRWVPAADAGTMVVEPELQRILSGFRQPPAPASRWEQAVPAMRKRAAEKVPMLAWFHRLMPTQGRFFEQFDAHAKTLVAGSEALARLLHGHGDPATQIGEIVRREHEADDITRDVLQDVRRVFVTPFDRSAITDLIGVMDDAIDQMNQTAKAIQLYEVATFPPGMQDMSAIVVDAARVTAEAIPLLRSLNSNASRLHELTGRLIELEGRADDVHDDGIKALFKSSTDPMQFVVGREIYSHLERIVDRFEDVANEIQGLVIDHA